MNGKIKIIGLGGGDINQLPLGIYRLLKSSNNVFFRTFHHPVVEELLKEETGFTSFDHIYEDSTSFQDVYQEIAKQLLKRAKEEEQAIIYAVPGHPLVAEKTVQLLLEKAPEESILVQILGGQSFIDPVLTALKIDPIDGLTLIDGTAMTEDDLDLRKHTIISQVYDQFVASEVKLTLMERYPDDYEVVIVTAAGSEAETLVTVKLYELDHAFQANNLVVVYVPPVIEERIFYRDLSYLKKVIATLRSPEGCPWDKEQTHNSLKKYLLEETYEVLEAIDEEDENHLMEELGDVLLQIMLHAQISEEEGYFSVEDVVETLTDKMIRRHPHVFANAEAETPEDVKVNWDKIKKEENGTGVTKSILDDVPKSLSGLLRAYKLQKKAAKVGFDWDTVQPVWDKVEEELQEFKIAVDQQDMIAMEKEFGDILFALVNLSRYYKIDPEIALNSTNHKFYRRFMYIESQLKENKLNWDEVNLSYLDELWENAKKIENKEGN